PGLHDRAPSGRGAALSQVSVRYFPPVARPEKAVTIGAQDQQFWRCQHPVIVAGILTIALWGQVLVHREVGHGLGCVWTRGADQYRRAQMPIVTARAMRPSHPTLAATLDYRSPTLLERSASYGVVSILGKQHAPLLDIAHV